MPSSAHSCSSISHGRRIDRPRHGHLACRGPAQAIWEIRGHFQNAHLAACHPRHTVAPRSHIVGALIVLGMVIWLAAVLRRRFGKSAAISKTRILLHAILGTQLLLGLGAYWSRLTTADAPQPMPLMVTLTVLHTVVGAILFGVSILIVLLCYRLVPRRRELPAATQRPVAI